MGENLSSDPAKPHEQDRDGAYMKASNVPFTIKEEPVENQRRMRVVIIGAGFSGIYTTVRITQRLRNIDLQVYEQDEEVSGVWWQNRYPGLACDIPSYSYHFSFAPNPFCSALYAPGPEIRNYMQEVAERFGAMRFIKTSHAVQNDVWDEDNKKWRLKVLDVKNGNLLDDTADILISCRGGFNRVMWPDIPGLHSFKNKLIHSGQWDEGYDLRQKRVGVIGNGSSAIQIVPAIQPLEGIEVFNFGRNPTWITTSFGDSGMEKLGLDPNVTNFSRRHQEDLARHPEKYDKIRKTLEDEAAKIFPITIKGTPEQLGAREVFLRAMQERLKGRPDLYEAMIPTFSPGCRRLTPGPGYLEALQKDNTTYVKTHIQEITEKGIKLVSGEEIDLDVIVCATGYDVQAPPLFTLKGRHGRMLADKWKPHPVSYLGVAVDEFPNLLIVGGPNAGLGSGSLVSVFEAQGDYAVKMIRKLQKEDYATFEVQQRRVEDFGVLIDEYFKRTVYMDNCTSWYRVGKNSQVFALWPGSSAQCLEVLRAPRWEDYNFESADPTGNALRWLGNGWSITLTEGDPSWYLDKDVVDVPLEGKPKENGIEGGQSICTRIRLYPGEPSNTLNDTTTRRAVPSVPAPQASIGVQARSSRSTQQQPEANEDLDGEDWFANGGNIDCAVSPTLDWDLSGSSARTETDGALPDLIQLDPASPEFGSGGGQSTLIDDAQSILGQRKPHTEADATVLYCHYTDLTVANLQRIPPQHVSFLDTQGCLRVPTRPTLDDFVEQYFKYVHPLLPLLNEGEFWDMYSRSSSSPASGNTMSLLVFQAMLFASCHLVTPRTIEKLGFSSFRSARAELYQRTKLLYDLEIEPAPLALAQAAILLMGWVPPENSITRPYRTWLSLAIQHARSINADRYTEHPNLSTVISPAQRKSRNAQVRLWGCCIIMDRISPLCTRMSIQLTHDHCEIKTCLALCQIELEDEVERSQVYSPATKRRLIMLFSRFLELIVILTDVLSLTFPFEQSVMSKHRSEEADRLTMVKCDTALKAWYERITAHFELRDEGHNMIDDSQNSMMLQTNMVLIYYHTALIAFGHYNILQLYSANEAAHRGNHSRLLDRCCSELQDAAVESARRFGLLTKHCLIRMLPISALACLAIPLALHIVSMRLSSIGKELALFDSGPPESPPRGQMNQQRLKVLTEAMKQFLVHYDGVELIKEAARHAADLAQTERPTAQQQGQAPATDWSQILAKQPAKYLTMTLTVDLYISKGRLPEEHDFPDWLSNQLRLAKLHDHGGQLQSASLNTEIPGLTPLSGTIHPGVGSLMDYLMFPDESNPAGQSHSPGDGGFDVLAEVAGDLAMLPGEDKRRQARDIDIAVSGRLPFLDLDGMKWSFP